MHRASAFFGIFVAWQVCDVYTRAGRVVVRGLPAALVIRTTLTARDRRLMLTRCIVQAVPLCLRDQGGQPHRLYPDRYL